MELKIKSVIKTNSEQIKQLTKLFTNSNEIFMVDGDTITLFHKINKDEQNIDFVTMLNELNETISGVVNNSNGNDSVGLENKPKTSNRTDVVINDCAQILFTQFKPYLGESKLSDWYESCDIETENYSALVYFIETIRRKIDIIINNKESEKNKYMGEATQLKKMLEPNIKLMEDFRKKSNELKKLNEEYKNTITKLTYQNNKNNNEIERLRTINHKLENSIYKLKKNNSKTINSSDLSDEWHDIKLNDFLNSMGLDKEDLIHDILGYDNPIIKVRRLF